MSGASFARQVQLAFQPGTLWPVMRQQVVRYARADRDRLIAQDRFPAQFNTFVNGVEGADEFSLRPEGLILYRGLSLGPAIAFALSYLQKRSPVLTGAFSRSFMVGVSRGSQDGRPIPMAQFEAARVGADATEAFIYSPLPYGRLVDVQLVGTRRLRFSVEPGLYDDAGRAVQRRFPMLNAFRRYTVQHPARERRQSDGRWIEYPALVIALRR